MLPLDYSLLTNQDLANFSFLLTYRDWQHLASIRIHLSCGSSSILNPIALWRGRAASGHSLDAYAGNGFHSYTPTATANLPYDQSVPIKRMSPARRSIDPSWNHFLLPARHRSSSVDVHPLVTTIRNNRSHYSPHFLSTRPIGFYKAFTSPIT